MRRVWFLSGLFLTTLATLTLELLDTRLLSVLTWYHLSFFAVSTALFGMSAGAVRVYLGGAAFEGERAPRALAFHGILLALAIPLSHVANLYIPLDAGFSPRNVGALALTTVVMAVPFYIAGVQVAISLTRVPGPSGLVYAVDLVGAALGSLLILPLLRTFDVSSAALVCGAIAAAAALCFDVFAGTARRWIGVGLAVALSIGAVWNANSPGGLRVIYSKGELVDREKIAGEFWTIHGQVTAEVPGLGKPWFWGPGWGAWDYEVESIALKVDGAAGTVLTRWEGDRKALEWVQHDVTALAFHLRGGGDMAVIGVGGGRDLLTAIWAGGRSITGIEINEAFVDMLNGRYREFAGLADRPEITLIHDEARSFLTRTPERYDVLQMSLIDTWAATGAGAFTLSENGLYTIEAWRAFFNVLEPRGILAVSRWYSPGHASEASRLLALGTAALLDRGVAHPRRHMALVLGGGHVATLLASVDPLSKRDLTLLRRLVRGYDFKLLLAPGGEPAQKLFGEIAESRSRAELAAVLADEPFDYSPPTDQRPYFFNMLKPGGLWRMTVDDEGPGLVIVGNLVATVTLVVLWVVSAVLVTTVILLPLWRSGFPHLGRTDFVSALGYFTLIGAGFMLVQIPLMQRFSVYLGHPTYAVAVILFSMILAAGMGSLVSDGIPIERERRWCVGIPLGIAVILLATTLAVQPVIDATIDRGLFARCSIVVALVTLAAFPLGVCLPFGLRLVGRLSGDAAPWMWGVNGASGVLASVSAVAISMWSGIDTSLYLAVAAYALLTAPALVLWRSGAVRAKA